MADPALLLVERVAWALGPLRGRVVFIGGAIAPLLHIAPPFERARPTKDVDAIAATVSYPDFAALQEALREQGFREIAMATHAHQWWAPSDPPVRFDLVPAGTHLGASGNPWDSAVVAAAVESEIAAGVVIRHASAAGFLALKLAAFRDRGAADPFVSHDLEDVFALLASRPTIAAEVAQAAGELREFVAAAASSLVSRPDIDDLLAGHLANVARSRARDAITHAHEALARIAASA